MVLTRGNLTNGNVQAILDEMAANIDWTDFLDALKLGLIHQAHARSGDGVSIEEAYILKVRKSADSTFQSQKICGKSA